MTTLALLACLCAAEPPKEKVVSGVVTEVTKSSVTVDEGKPLKFTKDTQYLLESGFDPQVVEAKELVKGKAVDLAAVDGVVVRVFIKRFGLVAPGEDLVRKALRGEVEMMGPSA